MSFAASLMFSSNSTHLSNHTDKKHPHSIMHVPPWGIAWALFSSTQPFACRQKSSDFVTFMTILSCFNWTLLQGTVMFLICRCYRNILKALSSESKALKKKREKLVIWHEMITSYVDLKINSPFIRKIIWKKQYFSNPSSKRFIFKAF